MHTLDTTRILNCLHCDRPVPEFSGHGETRCICPDCVQASLVPRGRSLSFPRDEQLDLGADPSTLPE